MHVKLLRFLEAGTHFYLAIVRTTICSRVVLTFEVANACEEAGVDVVDCFTYRSWTADWILESFFRRRVKQLTCATGHNHTKAVRGRVARPRSALAIVPYVTIPTGILRIARGRTLWIPHIWWIFYIIYLDTWRSCMMKNCLCILIVLWLNAIPFVESRLRIWWSIDWSYSMQSNTNQMHRNNNYRVWKTVWNGYEDQCEIKHAFAILKNKKMNTNVQCSNACCVADANFKPINSYIYILISNADAVSLHKLSIRNFEKFSHWNLHYDSKCARGHE